MKYLTSLEEFTKRLLPLTYFRRNAGEVIEKLEKVGTIILTKDGKPVAKLSPLTEKIKKTQDKNIEENLKKVRKFAGGYHLGPISPKKIKKIIMQQYEKVLP